MLTKIAAFLLIAGSLFAQEQQINLTTQVMGTLPAVNGGTAQNTWAKGDLLCSSAANALSKLNVGANTTILTADSASACGLKWGVGPQNTPAIVHQFVTAYASATGVFSQAQPSCGDLSDAGLYCNDAGVPPQDTPEIPFFFIVSFKKSTGLFTQKQPTCGFLSDSGSLCSSSGPLAATLTSATHQWLNSYNSVTGVFTQSQPAYSDISGTPTLAANTTATSHQYFTAYNSSTGAFTKAQPVCADLSDAGTFCTTSSLASSGLSDGTNVALYNATTAFTAAQTIIKAGIAGTPTNGLLLENTTASTSLATKQLAPNLYWQGHVWNTTATAADNCDEWAVFPNTTSGATPTSVLSFRNVLGASCGGALAELANIGSTGLSIKLGNTYQINGTQISAAALSNGTTGTAGTAVVLATSPALAGTATASALTTSGTVTFNSRADKLGENSISAATSGLNTTETVVVQSTAAIGVNRLVAGTTIRVRLFGTCTASVANTSTFGIRIGTAGTTSDQLVASFTTAASAASGTSIPFGVEGVLTIRTVGASGTAIAYLELDNQGTTGISTVGSQIIKGTMLTVDTTANNFISVTYKSAGATTTSTFDTANLEVIYK